VLGCLERLRLVGSDRNSLEVPVILTCFLASYCSFRTLQVLVDDDDDDG